MDIEKIIAFEEGTLEDDEMFELFQQLVDSGQAWTLQGFYGRMACRLIAAGHVKVSEGTVLPPRAAQYIEAVKGEA